ncbi:MAG TPA: hypothetical protein VMD59_21235, partial [Acidimicrobiales bacterium]|nr:hypothetical protein [Acidimicrobiales bacterium]
MSIGFADPATSVVPIASEADLIRVRRTLRAAAEAEQLSLVEQTKLITAGSELARNILVYATGARGELRVEQVRAGDRRGVR